MTEQPTTANHGEGELATVTYLPGATAVLEQPHPGAGPDPDESAPALGGESASTTLDLTKPTESEVLEGKVLPAATWVLGDDPEGDKPWINPLLKTKDGRKARRVYLQRVARRKARRWVSRQVTPLGMVPATLRGPKRVNRWVRGMEGMTADAAKARAEMTADEAAKAARAARFAVMHRDEKKKASEKAQQDASMALVQATAAAATAKKKFTQRAAAAYLPLAGVDVTGIIMEGVPGLTAGLLINAVVFARVGKTPDLAPEELEALERAESGVPERFELGMTPRAFENMLQQALTEDCGVKVYALRVKPHPWGFEVEVVLNRETPEKLNSSLALLESCLPGVRTNSILLQQSAAARNECTLRIPGENPWRAVPELPYRKPNSVTTNNMHKAQIGADMGGRSLALPLKRTNACVVGKSRSGKSTVLRAILDALTSTDDRIIIGIDLGSYGSGFGPYRRAMDAVACTTADARRVLEWALAVGMRRPALFDRFGMGLNWESSRERPGITVVIDEFPALVTASKQEYIPEPEDETEEKPLRLDALVQQLALTSAKSDVTLVVATQAVTSDRVGKNAWLSELPVQVMCACDTDDIKLIAGGGAMAQGWRPDRLLPAMGNAINDASVCYVLAGGDYCEPIPYRACITNDDEALRRAEERVTAGRPELDDASARFVAIRNVGDLVRDDIFALDDEDQEEEPAAPGLVLMKQIRELYRNAEVTGMTAPMLFEALAKADPDTWSHDRLVVPGEDGEDDTTLTEDELLAEVFKAVLEPHGQSWPKDKIRVRGTKGTVRGYALRDLKKILGETEDEAAEG
ncbi:hypothetical protein [Streptomyces sp. NPDC054842]